MKASGFRGSLAGAALALAVLFWQYVTVSNIPLSRRYWSDTTATYGSQFSKVPLPRALARVAGVASPVAFFPLGTILRSGEWKAEGAWQQRLATSLFPAEAEGTQAFFVRFALINAAVWITGGAAMFLAINARRRSSNARA